MANQSTRKAIRIITIIISIAVAGVIGYNIIFASQVVAPVVSSVAANVSVVPNVVSEVAVVDLRQVVVNDVVNPVSVAVVHDVHVALA